MIKINDKSKCCGCGSCANICPNSCIAMVQDEEGFYYPQVDDTKCIQCGACIKACTFKSVSRSRVEFECVAAKCFSNSLRMDSSSGGIFSLLAEQAILKGGIVYGVGFADDYKTAEFIKATSITELDKLRGSKYLQAQPCAMYADIKRELSAGKDVLFSGTACQVNGLCGYLDRDYPNLLCVDVICHGVPSAKLWGTYVDYINRKYKSNITNVSFRSKKVSWNEYGLSYTVDGKEKWTAKNEDAYLQLFLRDCCLRPSCYECVAKAHKQSDLTLGDCWGIDSINPQFNDALGVSLVLKRSDKGVKSLQEIEERMEYVTVPYHDAILHNPSENSSSSRPNCRDTFYKDLEILPFNKLIKKYYGSAITRYIKHLLRNTILWKFIRSGLHRVSDTRNSK